MQRLSSLPAPLPCFSFRAPSPPSLCVAQIAYPPRCALDASLLAVCTTRLCSCHNYHFCYNAAVQLQCVGGLTTLMASGGDHRVDLARSPRLCLTRWLPLPPCPHGSSAPCFLPMPVLLTWIVCWAAAAAGVRWRWCWGLCARQTQHALACLFSCARLLLRVVSSAARLRCNCREGARGIRVGERIASAAGRNALATLWQDTHQLPLGCHAP